MLEWQVKSVRFTVFLRPEGVPSPTLFRDISGTEPENSATQRSLGMRQETGPFDAGSKLTIIVQPMRIDLVIEPTDPTPDGMLGPFPAAFAPMRELVGTGVASGAFPPAQRLALGLVLKAPVADVRAGYRELRAYVSAVPDTPDASDFLFQINRPRDARVRIPNLRINRLSKWSVNAFHALSVGQEGRVVTTEPTFQCSLELDVNTSADFQDVLETALVPEIVDDLIQGAKEVAENGERV